MDITPKDKKNIIGAILISLGFLSLFLLAKTVTEIRAYDRNNTDQQNLISVSGEGEAFAVPDIATVTFAGTGSAKTMAGAQKSLNEQIAKAMEFLKASGIAEKDIKTENYNSYPKYEYKYTDDVVCGAYTCPPRPTNQVITGYEASQTVSVKVRDTDTAGTIIDGLGKAGLSNISGPSFSIDNEDEIKAEARKNAIDDARQKARVLARDLGVRLGDITSFSESSGGQMYYAKDALLSPMAVSAPASPEANLPKGENKITSSVTITWEIR